MWFYVWLYRFYGFYGFKVSSVVLLSGYVACIHGCAVGIWIK